MYGKILYMRERIRIYSRVTTIRLLKRHNKSYATTIRGFINLYKVQTINNNKINDMIIPKL